MAITTDDILSSHRTGRPVVMGILNVTPDSFYDGGQFLAAQDAQTQARQMQADGADIIDIGAESTRPGSDRVSADEQIARLGEILPAVVASGALVSIDTTLAPVARFAIEAGAAIINDVSGGLDDPEILDLAAEKNVPIVLMHMPAQPKTMQQAPKYANVVYDVRNHLASRVQAACDAGVRRENCIVDPGIGFGKTLEHNLALLAGMDELVSLGLPVLVGPSRKRFIGEITAQPDPAKRLGGTIAACLQSYTAGATIFRVHDAGPLADALAIANAIRTAGK